MAIIFYILIFLLFLRYLIFIIGEMKNMNSSLGKEYNGLTFFWNYKNRTKLEKELMSGYVKRMVRATWITFVLAALVILVMTKIFDWQGMV